MGLWQLVVKQGHIFCCALVAGSLTVHKHLPGRATSSAVTVGYCRCSPNTCRTGEQLQRVLLELCYTSPPSHSISSSNALSGQVRSAIPSAGRRPIVTVLSAHMFSSPLCHAKGDLQQRRGIGSQWQYCFCKPIHQPPYTRLWCLKVWFKAVRAPKREETAESQTPSAGAFSTSSWVSLAAGR